MMHPMLRPLAWDPNELLAPRDSGHFIRLLQTHILINVTVDNTFVGGNHIISLCTVKANHKDTGKPVNFTGTSTALVKNGQIMCAWNHFDFLIMNLQTGKIKPEQLARSRDTGFIYR
jgi:hypothetical protein